jgi:hypothetical protein
MHMIRLLRYAFPMACCCLILFCSACSSGGTVTPTPTASTASHTATVGSTPTISLSPAVTTAPVPPTLTSCPAAGTARAAVIAPLALGNHANIVYMAMEFSNGTYTTILNRFDVATGTKTVIVKLTNEIIRHPQISADGQWILFDQSTIQQDKLQMVRMDMVRDCKHSTAGLPCQISSGLPISIRCSSGVVPRLKRTMASSC